MDHVIPMNMLVLGGGGGNGAWQAGAITALRERDMDWDAVVGVSVGALNGLLVAQGRAPDLRHLWHNLTERDVYHKPSKLRMAWRLFRSRGLYDTKPLAKLVEREYGEAAFAKPLYAVSTNLRMKTREVSGPFPAWQEIVASASLPLLFPWVQGNLGPLVDGGVVDNIPLGVAVDFQPDHITIITPNPDPRRVRPLPPSIENLSALDSGRRSLDGALSEIAQNDIREFLRINKFVRMIEDMGGNEEMKERAFDCLVIRPATVVGETMDFSPESNRKRFASGRLEAFHSTMTKHVSGDQ